MSAWLHYASALSSSIPVAVFIYRFKKLNNELKLIAGLLTFAASVEIFVFITALYHSNNIWVMNCYTLLEGAVCFYVIGKWLHSERLFNGVMFLFLLYSLYWAYTTFISGSFINT